MFKVCPAQTLLPLQGVDSVRIYSQGVALGYALLPLRGVIKRLFLTKGACEISSLFNKRRGGMNETIVIPQKKSIIYKIVYQ